MKDNIIFIQDQQVVDQLDTFTWLSFLVISANLWQTVLYGTVKALNLNAEAVLISFITHAIVILPSAYFLTFYLGM